MQTLGKMFAAICAVLFVISTVLVLLLFNIERKAFISATYKQAFENQRLYERMPAILGVALSEYIAANGGAFPFLQILTVEDWQNNIVLLIPPAEMKAIGDQALDSTFDYVNGRTNSATLTLVPVKAHLIGDSGTQLVIQILQRQPPCTAEQLTQMALGLTGGQVILCNPPEQAIGLMLPFVQAQLQSMTGLLPNEITIIPGTLSGTPQDPRIQLDQARTAIRWSPLFPILFLFGIAVFGARTIAGWLTWWGWPLMIAGGISVLIGLFGSPVIGEILQVVIQNQGALFIPPVLASSIAETASAVASQMLISVVIQGFIIGFAGLGMVILSNFFSEPAPIQPI